MRAAVCIACQLGCAVVALAEPTLYVRVFNQARASPADVRAACLEAGRFLGGTGVSVVSCEESAVCREPLGDTGDLAMILRRRPAGSAAADSLGFSVLASAPQRTRYSFVYLDSVHRESARAGVAAAVFLGAAIAHEVGHVLLGAGHARTGLMRSHWGEAETRAMRNGTLTFAPSETTALRSAAVLRGEPAALLAAAATPQR